MAQAVTSVSRDSFCGVSYSKVKKYAVHTISILYNYSLFFLLFNELLKVISRYYFTKKNICWELQRRYIHILRYLMISLTRLYD